MKSSLTLDSVLAQALDLIATGASRDECLARFPEYADELAPLIDAAQFARRGLMAREKIPAPNLARGRARFLQTARPRPALVFAPRFALATAFAILLLVISGLGLSTASAGALPGDALYPIKLGFEQTQVALTFDANARAQLEEDHAARRRVEVQAVVAIHRATNVEFSGIVQSASGGSLIVSGVPLIVQDETDVPVGSPVQVQARTTTEGQVIARHIAQPSRTPIAPPPTITRLPIETRDPPPSIIPRPILTRDLPPNETRVFTPTRDLPPFETRVLIPPTRDAPPPSETRLPLPFATLLPRETPTRPASFATLLPPPGFTKLPEPTRTLFPTPLPTKPPFATPLPTKPPTVTPKPYPFSVITPKPYP